MINLRAQAGTYWELCKPGIVWGNALTAAAGFFLASRETTLNWALLAGTVAGLCCVIASAAVFNNYFDRDIDSKMARTRGRALATGEIANMHALVFATLAGAAGVLLLYFFTNPLSLGTALAGWVVYVALYTPLKPKSPYALYVGAFAGATPPVVGYVAVTNTFDWYAFALFAFLFLWQLPHFLAIAVYRFDEYKNAGVPLFIKKSPTEKQKRLARNIFFGSLVVLVLACLMLMLSYPLAFMFHK